jgi:hypothetical protein
VAPEPEGSSPHSQQPSNCPYPEPGESTPHPQPISLRSILIPSTPWSFKWFFSFGLSHQNPVHVSPLSLACHMPRPPHSPWFHLPNNIWWWVQIMQLPVVVFALQTHFLVKLPTVLPSCASYNHHTENMFVRTLRFICDSLCVPFPSQLYCPNSKV